VAAIVMCEKHGRRSRGGIPPEFGVGDAKANCPPQISSYRYKNERSVAFKIRQNPFSDPDPLVGWQGDTPPHTPPHSAPTHLQLSPCVPPEVQPDLRLWLLAPGIRGHIWINSTRLSSVVI